MQKLRRREGIGLARLLLEGYLHAAGRGLRDGIQGSMGHLEGQRCAAGNIREMQRRSAGAGEMTLTDGFLMPQVVDRGVHIIDIAPVPGPGLATAIWLDNVVECRDCGHMTMFFINRNGSTACWSCD